MHSAVAVRSTEYNTPPVLYCTAPAHLFHTSQASTAVGGECYCALVTLSLHTQYCPAPCYKHHTVAGFDMVLYHTMVWWTVVLYTMAMPCHAWHHIMMNHGVPWCTIVWCTMAPHHGSDPMVGSISYIRSKSGLQTRWKSSAQKMEENKSEKTNSLK